VTNAAAVEQQLREAAPRALSALVRRYGNFETCEDAVQEAMIAASVQWAKQGLPDSPQAWLTNVASRRWIEQWRSEAARARREHAAAALEAPPIAPVSDVDDTLTLLLLCCHPSLSAPSRVALTLRAVGGLTTAEIARAFLVPEATIGQRITRAKQRIKASGATFRLPPAEALPERFEAVLRVLYLIFNEGYSATEGPALHRVDLTAEAIRIARQVHELVPGHGEAGGLLALMLLTDARRPARTSVDGGLIPLADQDRSKWDTAMIAEGVDILTRMLTSSAVGPYQVQAAIAAVHAEAPRAEETDWPQILGLYDLLDRMAPGPMVTLSRVVAFAMVNGAPAGLRELHRVQAGPALAEHHRFSAVRAHLLELAGDLDKASAEFDVAARRTNSVPEQRYLAARAAKLRRASESGADRSAPAEYGLRRAWPVPRST
jgi:RNA polymerase sigma factor (sigma-70 family)